MKLKAILRILFSKRFICYTDTGYSWWMTQQNCRIIDARYVAKMASDIAQEELDGNNAMDQVEQILKHKQ